jgi:hypothetical protein
MVPGYQINTTQSAGGLTRGRDHGDGNGVRVRVSGQMTLVASLRSDVLAVR